MIERRMGFLVPRAVVFLTETNPPYLTKMRNPTGSRARFAKLASRSALATLALSMGASAFAQDAEPGRVIVTGSYIPTAETEGPLPVSVYTAQTLTKVGSNTAAEGLRGQIPSYVGATATENDSNGGTGAASINLRALGAGNTLTLINGRRAFVSPQSGVGFDINQIPLGAINRTEVLKDGASAIYGSDAVAGVVNFVLLNGPGASPFKGLEIDVLYGNTTDKDARVRQAYINAGWANEKFSIVISASYYDRSDIYSRDRDVSREADSRPLGGRNQESPTYPGRVTFNTNFIGAVADRSRVIIDETGLITGLASTRRFVAAAGDGFNFRIYTPAIPGQERWQYYGAFNWKPFGDGRLVVYGDTLIANTRQDNGLAPSPFTLGAANIGVVALRTSPFNPFGNVGTPTAANPGVGTPILNSVPYRFIQELQNRRSGFDTRYYRFEAGIRGDIPVKGNNFISAFNYDFGVLYEETKVVETDNGDARASAIAAQYLPTSAASQAVLANLVSGAALQNAIALNQQFGATFNPFIGQFAPIAGTAPIYNTAGVQIGTRAYDNGAAVARARYIGNSISQTQNTLYDARIGATLFPNLPQNGISFVLGAEYRKERSNSNPDAAQSFDVVTGFPDPLGFPAAAPNSFHRNVYSVYGEIAVPIITPTMKVPFVYSFDIQAAIRFEQFNTYGQDPTVVDPITGIPTGPFLKKSFDNGATPRLTIRWQPIDQVTIRGSYGRSFASPTTGQLFLPNSQNFPQISDPFRGESIQPASGVFQQGNPNLIPEKTNTYTAGIVFTPKFLKGFTLTADYYQLNTSSLIIGPASQAQVFASINGNSLLTGTGGPLGVFGLNDNLPGDPNSRNTPGVFGVFRDADGRIDQINAGFGNTGKRFVQGIDVVANYELPFDRFGKFTFTLGYNHFFTYKADTGAGFGNTNFLGKNLTSLPLTPGAVPYNKGFFRAEWEWRGFDFVTNVNYVGDYLDDASLIQPVVGNPLLNTNPAQPLYFYNRKSREYVTVDLQLSYEFKRPAAAPGYSKDAKGARTQVAADNSGTFFQRLLWGTKVRVGVNNVADTPPPFDPGAFNDNYDTNTFSIRNRYWYVGINKKF